MNGIINRIRGEMGLLTSGEAPVVHLNNAGASPMPDCVLNHFKTILDREQSVGAYRAADEYQVAFEKTRTLAGQLIHAPYPADEIALVDSATTAWMRAFYSVRLDAEDVVITCEAEYAANYVAMLQQAARTGARIEVVPSREEDGLIDVSRLEQMLAEHGERVKAVCVTHVPTNGGGVMPAEAVGRAVSAAGAAGNGRAPVYILDACQSVGQLPVDVQAIGCDFLSATGRKYLRGPRGTGFLFARRDVLAEVDHPDGRIGEPPTIDHFAAPWIDSRRYALSRTARRFEQWESNYAGICALGSALEYCLELGIQECIWPRIAMLGADLRRRLSEASPRITVCDLGADKDGSRCGIVSFGVEGIAPTTVKDYLASRHIFVAVSPAKSTLLDADRRGLPMEGLVRASVSYFNTELELEWMVDSLKELLIG